MLRKYALALGLSLLGLMACGQKAENSGGNSSEGSGTTARESTKETEKAEGEKSSDVTLSVSIWDTNQEPGLEEIMADFTKETGIKTKITVVRWADYWTAMEAAAQGGSLPDVFWMHSNESERYMSNGMLLDLTDWYNKKMFDEAGLAYPTADWTWDDLTESARKLKKPDGSQYGFCLKPNNDQAGYYNMILDRGGYILNDDKTKSGYDDPKSIEAMQILETWIKEDLIPSAETMSENSEDVLFQSGKVAMITQGSWMIAAHKKNDFSLANADCVELPKDKVTGRRVSIYNGLGWAAAANTKHKEEAWKLIEYMGSEKAQRKQAELGITMSAYKGTSQEWAKSAPFNLQAYLNMMEDMEILPFSRSTVTWEDANTELVTKVYTGELTMEEACKKMAAQMNEKLAEEHAK